VEIIDRFGFNAPAEVVYNNLTDPERAHRWLPPGLRIAEWTDERVRLAADRRAVDVDVDVRMIAAGMRLTFRCLAPVQVRGSARVKDTPLGGSQVDVVVNTDRSGPDPATVRCLIDQAMRLLERDVSDDFTVA
jgi:hypothetical protein